MSRTILVSTFQKSCKVSPAKRPVAVESTMIPLTQAEMNYKTFEVKRNNLHMCQSKFRGFTSSTITSFEKSRALL